MRIRKVWAIVIAALWAVGVSGALLAQDNADSQLTKQTYKSEASSESGQTESRINTVKKTVDRLKSGTSSSATVQALKTAKNQTHKLSSAQVRFRSLTGTPMQIKGGILEPAAKGFMTLREQDEHTAKNFLRNSRGLLGVHDTDAEFSLSLCQSDYLNRRHLRFVQNYKAIPVWPSDLIVHLNSDGDVDLMEGAYVSTPRKVSTRPAIEAENAVERARQEVPDGQMGQASKPELIFYAPGDRPVRLAWKIRLNISLNSKWLVVIDALNGATLTAFNEVKTEAVSGSGVDLFHTTRSLSVWKQGNTYYMLNASKSMYDKTSTPPKPSSTRGAIIVLDAENQPPTSNVQEIPDLEYVTSKQPNSGWIADAVSAAYNLSETYDYFLERHQRNSIDGSGGTINAIIRIGRNYENAAWVDELNTMIFGDGDVFPGALDVVAHELTHGVTSKTANLIYQDQPGALNEAFSDIFGEMAEARTNGNADWLMGTKLSSKIRSLSNPSSLSYASGRRYPSKMSEYVKTSSDNGGVHINSTIIGHAYYLLAQGLNGAIGIQDAERIFYRALAYHLVQNSRFIDARLACIASAEELFGKGSTQAVKTAEAFNAVEIYESTPTPSDPTPTTPINAEDSVLYVYYDSAAGGYFLNRKEPHDPAGGTALSYYDVSRVRPSVSGDGTWAVFVDSNYDPCFIATDGHKPEDCLGWNDTKSVAMSRDSMMFGFVFLDKATQEPGNSIFVYDLHSGIPASQSEREFKLVSPMIDGVSSNTIERADAMMFTSDNRYIYYDALNRFKLTDGSQMASWSIYAIHLETQQTLVIMPPVSGLDIGFPSLSQTSNQFIVFDVMNAQGNSTVYALNLIKGDKAPVATVIGDWATPCYSGDDSAIIYSKVNSSVSTGFSIMRQPIANDYITPVGTPTVWVSNGDYAAVYRRAGSEVTTTTTTLTTTTIPDTSSDSGGGGCFISTLK